MTTPLDLDRAALLDELAALLGVGRQELPAAFTSHYMRILKIGIHADLQARYPHADAARLGDWLRRYTGSRFYLKRTTHNRARHRHDLDGADVEPIDQGARYRAIRILAGTWQPRQQEATP